MSVAVNTSAAGILSHSTVASAGSASTNVGAVVSSTVIVCVWVIWLPHSSIAVHDLTKVYSESQALSVLSSLKTTEPSVQLSVAVIVSGVGTLSHSTVMSVGKASLKTGAVVSSIIIVCTSVAVFPQVSVTVNVLFISVAQVSLDIISSI